MKENLDNGPVTVFCCGEELTFEHRQDAVRKYYDKVVSCVGCESERYLNVLIDLLAGRLVATDGYF